MPRTDARLFRKVGHAVSYNVPRASDVAAGHVPSLPYEGEAEHRRGIAPRSASVCPLLCAVASPATERPPEPGRRRRMIILIILIFYS